MGRTSAGKRRKGLRDATPEASPVYRHVELACQIPFFRDRQIPPPPDLSRAQTFVANCDPAAISDSRGTQLARIQSLADASASTEQACPSCAPPEIKPAANKIKVAALATLMYQADLAGSEWAKQFIYGPPNRLF